MESSAASANPQSARHPGRDRDGKLVLIIGPSGVGKSVILKYLREKHPQLHFPRSATTRRRRAGEGDDLYVFAGEEEFEDLIASNALLEWAVVHGGARYGTLLKEILPFIDEGKTVIREVDVQGFKSIRDNPLFSGEDAPYRLQSIFILPESVDQLIAHIRKRAPMDDEELKRRVRSMEREMACANLCTAAIVNREGKIEDTLREVEQLVLGE